MFYFLPSYFPPLSSLHLNINGRKDLSSQYKFNMLRSWIELHIDSLHTRINWTYSFTSLHWPRRFTRRHWSQGTLRYTEVRVHYDTLKSGYTTIHWRQGSLRYTEVRVHYDTLKSGFTMVHWSQGSLWYTGDSSELRVFIILISGLHYQTVNFYTEKENWFSYRKTQILLEVFKVLRWWNSPICSAMQNICRPIFEGQNMGVFFVAACVREFVCLISGSQHIVLQRDHNNCMPFISRTKLHIPVLEKYHLKHYDVHA